MRDIKMSPLNAYALNNEDAYAVARITVELATPLKESFNSTLQTMLQNLDERSQSLGERLKLAQYKSMTKKIVALNRECDLIFTELRTRVSVAFKTIIDPVLAQKGSQADSFIEPYKNIRTLPQATQVQLTNEMLAKLQADEAMTQIFTDLACDAVIAALTDKNNAFGDTIKMRNDLIGDQKELSTATATKYETTKAYVLFCNTLFNQYKTTPTDELHALLSDINVERVKYATIVAAAKTRREEK